MTKYAEPASSSIRNEEKLLLCCARTRVSTEMGERIHALVRGPLDWEICYSAAGEHGTLPLLCRNLLAICPEEIPEIWREKLKADLFKITQRNLFLTATMLGISERLHAEGLLAVPYKGPLLAALAYGDFALRQFTDLDFAIHQRDIHKAQAILLGQGYQASFGEVGPQEGARPTHSEYQYIRSEGRVIVELQTETTLRYYPRPLDFEAMGRKLKPVSVGGGQALTFSAEDTLLLLSVHGAKHFWERLLWIADIAELVQVDCGMDWHKAFARSEEFKAGRMVRLALYVAHIMLDAPLPADVMKIVHRDSEVKNLGEIVRSRFSLREPTPLGVFDRFRFRVMSRETMWQGVPYALRLATSPTNSDRDDLPLPQWLSGARAYIRPLLLTKRYGVRRSKTR